MAKMDRAGDRWDCSVPEVSPQQRVGAWLRGDRRSAADESKLAVAGIERFAEKSRELAACTGLGEGLGVSVRML